MRILVDIRHLNSPEPSGVGEYTLQLLRTLFDIDKVNEYILLSSGKTVTNHFSTLSNPSVRCVHLPLPNKLLNARIILLQHPHFNWYIREAIDLIFLPNLNVVSLPTDIPTILTIHDVSWKFFPELYSKKMQLWHRVLRPEQLMHSARHIISPSESTTQDVIDTFSISPARLTTIPHGVDPMYSDKMQARDHGVRSRYKLPKRFALFVGTLEPRKNLLALIEGIKQYRRSFNDDISLVLVGKWGWKSTQLRHRLWKRDVKDWIHPIGYIPAQDKPAFYRSAQIFTWPSLYEGFGLPVLEAMACGTPVITSRNSSLPELTNDAAILLDPYNSDDMTSAIKHLLRSQPLQQRLRTRGLEQAKHYSWIQTAQRTLKVFEKENS